MGKAKTSVQQWESAKGAPDTTAGTPRRSYSPFFMPRGMSLEQSARYIGLSATKFTELVHDGRMPPPRAADGRRLWCRYALDEAFDELPEVTRRPTSDDNPWRNVRA